ncbi:hypothetical protein A4R43_32560 [Amycolatopsis albispora]|uniref:SD-repeat containing protein B domain-containing protein n=1 Tax=Amycolatopsis albispora TaxID=1804986 RepID=A0A344LEX1_9PSEU|nr:hypothetical protein A4R43_32560 [Amycolatopsis albispora]
MLAALACLLTSCGGVAAAATPHFVGDYVWLDTDRNGLQDPGEPPVEGVRATLLDASGTAVETTRSGENGRYLFGDLPEGSYHVCFALDALPIHVADHHLTSANAGNDAVDSDVDPATGCTGPALTATDLTLDAGLSAPGNELGDYAWLDQDADGTQDPAELPVEGVRAALHHGDGTPTGIAVTTGTDGRYTFSNLRDGTYLVCFDLDGRQATTPGAGDESVDSDADPSTGCTEAVTVGLGARQDLTLDLGLLPAPGTPAASP